MVRECPRLAFSAGSHKNFIQTHCPGGLWSKIRVNAVCRDQQLWFCFAIQSGPHCDDPTAEASARQGEAAAATPLAGKREMTAVPMVPRGLSSPLVRKWKAAGVLKSSSKG